MAVLFTGGTMTLETGNRVAATPGSASTSWPTAGNRADRVPAEGYHEVASVAGDRVVRLDVDVRQRLVEVEAGPGPLYPNER